MRLLESGGGPITHSRPGPATIEKLKIKENNTMKDSTKDNMKGVFHQLAGKARAIAGRIIKSPGLETEGKAEIVAGSIQKKTSQIKKVMEK